MDDATMESIEPFDMNESVDFNTAYLSGFLADKYDVEAKSGEERIRQRVGETFDDLFRSTFFGYDTVRPTNKLLNVNNSKARYMLLPVWMLHTRIRHEWANRQDDRHASYFEG